MYPETKVRPSVIRFSVSAPSFRGGGKRKAVPQSEVNPPGPSVGEDLVHPPDASFSTQTDNLARRKIKALSGKLVKLFSQWMISLLKLLGTLFSQWVSIWLQLVVN